MGGDLCDYPQVLLFALPPAARKGECEGETFAGFPTRVQSPARRRPLLRSKSGAPKKTTTLWVVAFFWSGRRGSNSLPGIPRMAVAIRRSPASPLDLTRFAQVEAASSPVLRHIPKKNTPSCRMGYSFCDCPPLLLSGNQRFLSCVSDNAQKIMYFNYLFSAASSCKIL